MTVVVGAPNVNRFIKAACDELVAVIGNIRGKIGRVAVLANEHVVFEFQFFNLFGRFAFGEQFICLDFLVFIPQRAVFFIGHALFG